MHVTIDARVLHTGRRHGIARVVWNLLADLARDGRGARYSVLAGPGGAERLPALGSHMRVVPAPWPPYSASGLWRVPLLLRRLRPDVYHCPTFFAPPWTPCPAVVNVYDLIHLAFPGDYGPRQRLYYHTFGRLAYRRARAVVACSQATAADLSRRLGVPRARVRVQLLALDRAFEPSADPAANLRDRLGLEPPFVLSVVNPRPHKNAPRLARAYALLRQRADAPPLVMVGVQPGDLAGADRDVPPGGLYCFTEVGDQVLADLYATARAFVLPSLAEGFGLPVLEAMQCGTPVASSRIGPLTEVAGPAAEYFDPTDEHAMADALARLLADPAHAQRLGQAGRARASAFRITDWVDQVVATYHEAVGV